MKLKLNKILASALVTGLLVLSGHAAAEPAAAGPDIPLCNKMRGAVRNAMYVGNWDLALMIGGQMDSMGCPVQAL